MLEGLIRTGDRPTRHSGFKRTAPRLRASEAFAMILARSQTVFIRQRIACQGANSRKTHDRITKLRTLAIAGLVAIITFSFIIAIVATACFAFSGFMFGPDLDIHSRQYLRWPWLRWVWLPYQKRVKHRSWVSHGPVAGTVLRLVYLALAVIAATIPISLAQ